MSKIRLARFGFGVLSLLLIACYVATTWSYWDRIRQANSDFIIYYTATQIVRSGHRDQLYDLNVQEKTQKEILQKLDSKLGFREGLLPYNHPPFELVWFYGLSGLSYLTAFWLWNLFSCMCLGLALWVVKADLIDSEVSPTLLSLGALAFFPVFVSLLEGQDSLLLLLWLSLSYRALKNSRDFSGGLCLALAMLKPQLIWPSFLLLAWKQRWKALGGFAVGLVGLLMVSVMLVGVKATESYFWMVIEMAQWRNRYGLHPARMHTLRGQIYLLIDPYLPELALPLTIVTWLGTVYLMIRGWSGSWSVAQPGFQMRFALLILVSLLVSPHLYFHDLSLLILPFTLILVSRNPQPPLTVLKTAVLVFAYLVVWISYPIFGKLPLHLTVLGMVVLTLLTAKAIESSRFGSPAR
jgi:hypothetical protein